jgi:sugar phosphate isomerase/epimerase
MKTLLSSGCLYTLPLENAFYMAAEAGYDGMEVIVSESFGQDEGYRLLGNLKEILPIYVLHAPFHVLPGWGDRMRALRKTIEMAKGLSVHMVHGKGFSTGSRRWKSSHLRGEYALQGKAAEV